MGVVHQEEHVLGGGARLLAQLEHGAVAAVLHVAQQLHQLRRALRALRRARRHLLVHVADTDQFIKDRVFPIPRHFVHK